MNNRNSFFFAALVVCIFITAVGVLLMKRPKPVVIEQPEGPWFSTPFKVTFENGVTGNIQFQLHPSSNVHWRIVR